MPKFVKAYVRYVDKFNYYVGKFAMYLIFAMIGILLYSSFSKTFLNPALWTLEMAQFTMVSYYLLGGAYSIQMGAHVRMDLAYGRWSEPTKARVDTVTTIFLIFFLVLLLYGGINSTIYAIEYGEESRSIWAPKMWPVKIIMDIGIFLTLLQAISSFLKRLAAATGRDIA